MSELINIVLNDNLRAQAFGGNNNVHPDELKSAIKLIAILVRKADNYDPTETNGFVRCNNAITVSGERGTGKTSFLLSLMESFKCTNKESDSLIKEAGSEIQIKNNIDVSIPIIDPTLIEQKEHIFLNIIAYVREVVNDKIKCYYREDNQTKYCEIDEWQKSIKSLAKGLPILDSVKGGLDCSDWNDASYAMEEGLAIVNAANNLERNFHIFIYNSLKLINVSSMKILCKITN